MTAPKLPSERALARMLRDLHAAWTHPSGGSYVGLRRACEADAGAHAVLLDTIAYSDFGCEYVPGDECPCARQECPKREGGSHCNHWWDGHPGKCCACGSRCTFDATAAARRLLVAAREAGFR